MCISCFLVTRQLLYSFVFKLEMIEMCNYVLLFGLDFRKTKKGLTSCDSLDKVQLFPICGYQIRTVF